MKKGAVILIDQNRYHSFMVLFLHDFKGLVAFIYALIFPRDDQKAFRDSVLRQVWR